MHSLHHVWRPWWDTLSGNTSLLLQLTADQQFLGCFQRTFKQLVFGHFFLDGNDGRWKRLGQILNWQLDGRVPPEPSPESTVSTAPHPESQDGRDARYRFSYPDGG